MKKTVLEKENKYNEKSGYCHIVPPMWQGNGMNCKCFWAAVELDDFCSKAERREDVGDSVFEISEIEKLKEEKHQLKVSVQFLVNEMKSFCFFHFHNGKCANYYHGCYQTCEFYKAIKKYDCLEGDK